MKIVTVRIEWNTLYQKVYNFLILTLKMVNKATSDNF